MKMSTDILIIGAGLFGSMTAKYLRDLGHDVQIIDSREQQAASKCSSGIYRESWINKIKAEVEISLPIIKRYTQPKKLPLFDRKKGVIEDYMQIDVRDILNEEFLHAEVFDLKFVGDKVVGAKFNHKGKVGVIDVKVGVVVCAGAWTGKLLQKFNFSPMELDTYWGVTFEYGKSHKEDFISTWAPYRQLYGFNYELDGQPRFYFTGGVSVKNLKPSDKRKDATTTRMLGHSVEHGLKTDDIIILNEGLRPYLKKGESYVVKRGVNVFAASGGAKNSTVLSGYVAKTIADHIETLVKTDNSVS